MTKTRFTAEPQLRRPGQFLRDSRRSLTASLPLARRLFVRDLKARYRLSALGFVWMFLPGIAQTGVWIYLNAANIVNGGDTSVPYPLYVLLGTLIWQGFTDAVNMPRQQLANASQMLTRVNFPAESLILAGMADVAVNTVVRLLIAVPVLIAYRVSPGWGVLLSPLPLLVVLVLGVSIGLLIAPFGLLYHDLDRLLGLVLTFWMLVTPVAYVLPPTSLARTLSRVNPVSQPLNLTRDWLTGGALDPGTLVVAVFGASVVLLTIAWALFRLSVPHLVDRFGA